MSGGVGARRGFSRETMFVDLINNDSSFRNNFENALRQLNLINGQVRSAIDVKSRCKSDVKVLIIDKRNNPIELGCSLKAAAEANFNQLDRRWLSDWSAVLQMPSNIEQMIQSSLDRKIKNSRDIFILPSQEKLILPFFEQKKEVIFRELLTRDDENLKAFITYDENNNGWFLSRIEDVIDLLKTETISTTSRGVLRIGDCLTLQRKGGDGNITIPPKTSSLHPSNQLQFKIKPLSLINRVRTIQI